MRAAVLFSGRGSNMGALLRAARSNDYPVEYVISITDNESAQGRELAQEAGVKCEYVEGLRAERETQILRLFAEHRVEIVVLAGYMRLLSEEFVERFYGRILNIHPSLLPEFKGLNPQQQAIDAGASESGCSVHLVTAEMDGGPVIGQTVVPVYKDDTADILSERILVEEHKLYPHIVAQYAEYLKANPITDNGLLNIPFSAVKEECGIFACHAVNDALALTIFGLHALQHRGQEGAGIASMHENQIFAHRDAGLVSEVFSKNQTDDMELPGAQMIGHLRYSTAGGKAASNLQPFVMQTRFGPLGLAHNGNLTNADELRLHLMDEGQLFFTDSDSEVFLHLVAQSSHDDLKSAIIEACQQVTGAFSIMVLSTEGIYAARDTLGLRPLCLGKRENQLAIASESTALEATDMSWQFDIEAGELILITPEGDIERTQYAPKKELSAQKFCAFEYVYFMRANSAFNDRYTARVRERIGMQLFHEAPVEADYVVPVPESGIFAAIGYSQSAALPFHFAILKSSYVGRTFIEPQQELRHFGVRLKLSIDRWHIKGKRIILVDDSIVRANTLPKLVQLLKDAGAAEIHVRIAAPTIEYPCFYGVDMPSRKELSAANNSVDEIRDIVGADSLAFVSKEGLRRAIDADSNETIDAGDEIPPRVGTCMACFSGEYPAPLCDQKMQDALVGSEAKYDVKSPGLLFARTRKSGSFL